MKYSFLIALIPVLIFAGCGTKESNDPAEQVSKAAVTRNVEVINQDDLAEIINNREGKVLFLNLWATWCEPCVEEFPDIVKLDQNYKDKNVEIIAVSVDMESDIQDKVIPFLEEQGVDFKVYLADEKSAEKIIELLNADWSGAVPASFVFNADGKQKKFLLGLQTYEQMTSAIESAGIL